MRLQKLVLTNFKGIRSLEINANGEDFTVRGKNGVGKTTIADAVTWLLFGKDTMDRQEGNFGIKTKIGGKVLHNLEHTVEADYIVKGHAVTLKRAYKEKWTKQRGSNVESFTGHTTEYFINDVPKSQKEYQGYIASIIDEKVFKLLTNPLYFNDILKVDERRKILIDLAGDIPDSEVMSTMGLDKLEKMLNNYSFDEIKKMAAEKKKKINKQLEQIPARIDELTRTITDVEFPNRTSEKQELQEKIEAVNNEIAGINNGTALRSMEQDLRDLDGKESDLKREWRENEEGKTAETRKEIEEINEKIRRIEIEIRSIESNINLGKEDLEETNKRIEIQKELLEKLKAKYIEAQKEAFMPESESLEQVCPTCGQKIPEEQIREATNKALEQFNREKVAKLEELKDKGTIERKYLDDLEVKIKDINERIAEKQEQKKEKTEALQDLKLGLFDLENTFNKLLREVDFNGYKTTQGYNDIENARNSLKSQLSALRQGNADMIADAENERESLKAKMNTILWEEAKMQEQEKANNRIAELEAQEKELAAEYEKWQGVIFQTEEFTKAKVEMLTAKIDSKFKIAKFKMFEQAINGGIRETCIATGKDGVAWDEAMNTGQKNNIGLDIINTLCEFYDFAPPIFIDNAESITVIPETRGQLVKLVHDAEVKELEIK